MKVRMLRGRVSNGASAIAEGLKARGLDVKKLRISDSAYRGRPDHFILNWGSTTRKTVDEGYSIFNKPQAVSLACDKIKTFRKLDDAGMLSYLPRYTTNRNVAENWIEREFETVFCRQLTTASQGRGIVLATTVSELVDAPLYTAKVPVEREVRIHIFAGQMIDYAQKKRMGSERRETEGMSIEVDENIRSHRNGWVFAREGVSIPTLAEETAKRAVSLLGLDFGAVDMAITPQGAVKIYEVNSAPGLEGTTLQRYVDAIHNHILEEGV